MNPNNSQTTLGLAGHSEHAENSDNSDIDPSYLDPPRSRTNFSAQSRVSLPSSIPAKAKKALIEVSPEGTQCIITRHKSHVECSHILRRASKSSDLTNLEHWWGCQPHTLNLDVPENLIWLSPDMHRCFNRGHWALVPSLELLRHIWDTTGRDIGRNVYTHFTRRYPNTNRQYTYVSFRAGEEPITRFDESHETAPSRGTLHHSPFFTLPSILSHVHPYFVICNVAINDIKHCPEPNRPEPEPELESVEVPLEGYETLNGHEELLERVRMCRRIYLLWTMTVLPTASGNLHPNSRTSRNSQSNPSSGPSTRRSSQSATDNSRTRDNAPQATDIANEPCRQSKPQDSALTGSDSMLDNKDDELTADEGQYGHADIPYWAKVENWLQGVNTTFPTTGASIDGVA
ncbi:HNH endonuclease [Rhizoctonia solani AG-3 Rhs1AP]|uniref:HNH endonuclease n=2 Tax=Rhizoctonia solani AG-3 TaxID=1086053 RepID=A0A074SK50_9AGAM|nr:HNH endonuclease [Rhizoctonia solani AG-3 Rhs1AP]KEP50412.1 HNH endonuclease [Rhizoctonia solani 123E]